MEDLNSCSGTSSWYPPTAAKIALLRVRFTVIHKFDPVVSGIGGMKRLRPLRSSSAEVLQSARRAVLFY